MDLQEVKRIIEKSASEFRVEILNQIDGLIKIDRPFSQEASKTYNIFSTRHSIQKDITKHNYITGWNTLLPELEKVSHKEGELLKIFRITGEDCSYQVFTNVGDVLGILKFTEIKIERNVELIDDKYLRGVRSDCSFYLDGERLYQNSSP